MSGPQEHESRVGAAERAGRALPVRPVDTAREQDGAAPSGGAHARVLPGRHRGAEPGEWRQRDTSALRQLRSDLRFSAAVKISTVVFWVVTTCDLGGYQRFGGTSPPFSGEKWIRGDTSLWNAGNHMASQPRPSRPTLFNGSLHPVTPESATRRAERLALREISGSHGCILDCWVPIGLMMEAASTSETSVNLYQTTRRYNPLLLRIQEVCSQKIAPGTGCPPTHPTPLDIIHVLPRSQSSHLKQSRHIFPKNQSIKPRYTVFNCDSQSVSCSTKSLLFLVSNLRFRRNLLEVWNHSCNHIFKINFTRNF
jgi:hypothetical protein